MLGLVLSLSDLPFEGYEDEDYGPEFMAFILQVESIQAKALGEWVIKNLAPKSVLDVGCANGIYLIPYKEAGIEVLGIDASSAAGEFLAEDEFERVDLRFPYAPPYRFDLAYCLEVGEHLPPHYADRIVDTVCDCADIVVWSAGLPQQGGTNHHHEQPAEYWLQKFEERHGYVLHPLHSEMRDMFAQFEPMRNREVSGWIISNSWLLHKKIGI